MKSGMKYEDRDMSPKARAVYEECLRRMTPEQKLQMASRMRDRMKELALAGVRMQYPDFTDEQARAEVRRRMDEWHKLTS